MNVTSLKFSRHSSGFASIRIGLAWLGECATNFALELLNSLLRFGHSRDYPLGQNILSCLFFVLNVNYFLPFRFFLFAKRKLAKKNWNSKFIRCQRIRNILNKLISSSSSLYFKLSMKMCLQFCVIFSWNSIRKVSIAIEGFYLQMMCEPLKTFETLQWEREREKKVLLFKQKL